MDHSTLLYSTLLFSTLLHFFFSSLLCSALLSSPLPSSPLLYFTLLYSTLLYCTLLYSTLRYSTLLCGDFPDRYGNLYALLPPFTFFLLFSGRSNSYQTVHHGEAVEMRCEALEGKTVRWSKDGVVLQTKTAGHGTSLHISSAQQSDEGIYTCDVISSSGQMQASYDVTVRVEGQYCLQLLNFYNIKKDE